MAVMAWSAFFMYRKWYEGNLAPSWYDDNNFIYGVLIIPVCWILFYHLFDQYKDIYRLSRLATFFRTLLLSIIGVIVLFFTLILDDFVVDYKSYYHTFLILFLFHFGLTVISRMIILTWASLRLKSGWVGFNTVIVGGDQKALDLYNELTSSSKSLGYQFIGFIDSNGHSSNLLKDHMPMLGNIEDIPGIIDQHEIEEVIIAIETNEHDKLKGILDLLFDFEDDVLVKIIPDMYDILLGTVKMNHIYGAVLIEIERGLMPRWQKVVKRIMDIVASSIAIVILTPILLYVGIRVYFSSKGPVFYRQERVGLNGKPFKIIKFRSMYLDAEKHGPQLSKESDSRVTPWGHVIRKWRLDELPQFWNVLKGDMSLVGPRPERQFFIDQITQHAPHYKHLLKVRPGITSWGQVKFGYASNIDQMLQRLKFDILYIENMSISLDIKILFYTVLVLLQGKGK